MPVQSQSPDQIVYDAVICHSGEHPREHPREPYQSCAEGDEVMRPLEGGSPSRGGSLSSRQDSIERTDRYGTTVSARNEYTRTSGILNACNGGATHLAALCIFGVMLSMSLFLLDIPVFAEASETRMLKLDEETSLEETVTVMSVPKDNALPWGIVRGTVNDPSQGYPVIIQFFKSVEEEPIHVAQVNLKGDDSFEYRFRVFSIDDGNVTHFFKGDYTVKIFKVVNTPQGDLDSV